MFPITISTALLVGWPEAFIMLFMGFRLSNIKNQNISKMVLISGIQAIITYFVRKFFSPIGIHTLIHIFTLSLMVQIVLSIKFYKAVISVLIGTIFEGTIQILLLPQIMSALHIGTLEFSNNPNYIFICFIPVLLVSLICIRIIKNFNILIWDVEN